MRVVIFYLFKSRTSLFHREKKIYHKVNALILESMCVFLLSITRVRVEANRLRMPPVICQSTFMERSSSHFAEVY